MEKKQTAVNWLVDQIKSDQNQKALSASEWMQVIERAKEMEKEQIIDAYCIGKFTRNKKDMSNTVSYEYPKELFDDEGYPTSEALDYIKNWSVMIGLYDDMLKNGQFFGKEKYDDLIAFVYEIWWGNDLIRYEDGLLQLHTGGWSGNEEIISELKHTDMWMHKFRCNQSGGHYYFKIDNDTDFDWQVVSYRVKDEN